MVKIVQRVLVDTGPTAFLESWIYSCKAMLQVKVLSERCSLSEALELNELLMLDLIGLAVHAFHSDLI